MTEEEKKSQWAEEIRTNHKNIIFLVKLCFGLESDEMLLANCIQKNTWSKFTSLGKARQQSAKYYLAWVVQNAGRVQLEYDIMYMLYNSTLMRESDFLESLGDNKTAEIIRQWEEMKPEIPRKQMLPSSVDIRLIAYQLSECWEYEWTKENMDSIISDIWTAAERFKKAGWLDYEKVTWKDNDFIQISMIKDPSYYLKNDAENFHLTSRNEPMSISEAQNAIRDLLYWNNIPFTQEYGVDINGKTHRFDFAVYGSKGLEYFIEYDGQQHYVAVDKFGGEAGLKERKLKDQEKNEYCEKNHIPLIRIPYTEHHIELTHLIPKYSKYVR